MIDLLLIFSLGFLGSFGHCLGMCGPIAVAFSLSHNQRQSSSQWQQLRFHCLLNLGRMLSYCLVGIAIGTLGSILVAGGQMAGVGSDLRRGIAIFTGILMIWFGLVQLNPQILPKLPLLNPMLMGNLHDRFTRAMNRLALQKSLWTPLLLGMVWGLIPCGFLYAAQIKAAETTNMWQGGLTMLAFGLGTFPTMMGVGMVSGFFSRDRRTQLFRLGGWITILIGLLTLIRTGDKMVAYASHGALLCLFLALIARPISKFWSFPLVYRRALGVGAFILSLVHTIHVLEHSWGWNLQAFAFMLPQHQWGIVLGGISFVLMIPLALTSFDQAQSYLGLNWRKLHLLSLPIFILAAVHCLLVGAHYLGSSQITWLNVLMISILALAFMFIILVRSPFTWSLLSLEKFYVAPKKR